MRNRFLIGAAVIAVCALTAVATALAAGASKHAGAHHKNTTRKAQQEGSIEGAPHGGPGGPGGWGGPGGGPGGGAVHSESVVLDKAGTAFITVTTDNGTVKSVEASSEKLTIEESAKSVAYKTVTLTIPSAAKVTLDGKASTLEALKEGDHVTVSSSSEGTVVFATDSSFSPENSSGHGGPGGPPPSGGYSG